MPGSRRPGKQMESPIPIVKEGLGVGEGKKGGHIEEKGTNVAIA